MVSMMKSSTDGRAGAPLDPQRSSARESAASSSAVPGPPPAEPGAARSGVRGEATIRRDARHRDWQRSGKMGFGMILITQMSDYATSR